ncbi:MAG TPA: hypothetical protein VLE19_07695 [Pyrinomonadaceae bacterium]|nr:hypothetical protein [Pyrinomonadaceae bacterium]
MNNIKIPLVVLLTVVLTALVGITSSSAHVTSTLGQSTALERGYRTGYSDGYSAGIKDAGDHAARDYQNKEEYQRADRSFNDAWGAIEDYRDGYQQGFESGYAGGYDHQQFDSTIPANLRRRQAGSTGDANVVVRTDTATAPGNQDNTPTANGSLGIPRNTILSLELITPISTDVSQRNDPFKARVVQPAQFAGYVVEGRVTQVKRPGKVKGVAELQLSFDQIRSPDNRTAAIHAELLEIVPLNSDSRTEVDPEGGVRGSDSTKDDAAKIGAASGVGAIIGAIAGGGKGAAIGAIIGGGAGTAGTMTQRGKDIRLEQGQQLRIRTSTDTSVL